MRQIRVWIRRAWRRMAGFDRAVRARTSAAWKWIGSRLTRERARRLGYYAAMAALLAMLGIASYGYRTRNARAGGFDAVEVPRMVMAVQTPEPAAEPTPEPTPEPMRLSWPVEGEIIGEYAPDALVWSATLGQWQTHPGIDIAAAAGETVSACADGVIADMWVDALWGNAILIDHGDGLESTYANLGALNLVSVGDQVQAGQVISAVGRTAACESDMLWHLHFSIEKDGKPVDFEKFMRQSGF